MNNDPTQKLPGDEQSAYDTAATISAVMERINVLGERLEKRIKELQDDIGIRLDRIDGMVHTTRGEVLALRADFYEHRKEFKELLPQLESKPS